jgi:carboxymethylenebutenolidase
MCFDEDSRPPIPPIAGAAVDGKRIVLQSADGTQFAAFAAQPSQPNGAGMLILPDVRGLHGFYEELALRFAEAGVTAIAIDYFGRTAGVAERGPNFDPTPHVAQLRYEQLLLDAKAARDHLGEQREVRATFGVGFCFAGRLAFVTATRPELDLAGAIGFYGVPVGPGRGGLPAPVDAASDMLCPILGLFGGADGGIPPEAVDAFEEALTEAGIDHELVVYPGAPHSFFDRKAAEHADASTDAWRRVLEFVHHHTPTSTRTAG